MLYYERLVNSLKRGVVSAVYLFYGEEHYLRERMVEKFKEYLLPQGAEFNFDVLAGEDTAPGQVVSLASTPPFMAEKRLIMVKNPPWFGSSGKRSGGEDADGGLKQLMDYIQSPLATTCLIFNVETVDRRKKIFKVVEKYGQVVNFVQLSPAEMAKWLDQQARASGKRLDKLAKEQLLTSTTSGLTGLVPEWNKLITYIGDRDKITADDVNEIVHRSVEYKIFDVLDAIGARRYDAALTAIRELLANREPPQVIMTMVARQFRLMLQVKELGAAGLAAADIAKRINEKPYPVKKALKMQKNFNREQLINVLIKMAQLDADIKTGRREFYPGLEGLLLELAD